jgi:hypothetical protein
MKMAAREGKDRKETGESTVAISLLTFSAFFAFFRG